jgi:hypothetical protein
VTGRAKREAAMNAGRAGLSDKVKLPDILNSRRARRFAVQGGSKAPSVALVARGRRVYHRAPPRPIENQGRAIAAAEQSGLQGLSMQATRPDKRNALTAEY